jgi:RimJ/RimL family protein N-acetyltransferase
MAQEKSMELKPEFQWRRPPFALLPYDRSKGILKADILHRIYDRLHAEDLYKTVFHDNPDMDLLDFMNFFSFPSVSLQVIATIEGDEFKDIAGISWLSGLESYGHDAQRGIASFCVFRDYQRPDTTDFMANFVMDYWFNFLKLDIVVGMTPVSNALALRFIKRIGFQPIGVLPGYNRFLGAKSDCMISYVNKDLYKMIQGG